MDGKLRALSSMLGVLAGILCIAMPLGAQSAPSSARTLRESLRREDQVLSGRSAVEGIVPQLAAAMSDDAIMLLEGAPILRGRDHVMALLNRQSRVANIRASWQPLRVIVSEDGTLGVTFGTTAIRGPSFEQNTSGRYVSVWRRQRDNWSLVAQVQTDLIPAGGLTLPAGEVPGTVASINPRDPFALADLSFAMLARDSTAPIAFRRFSAPNGVTFAGTGELNIGPDDIFRRMSDGPAARADWRWWPVLTIAAASGDLGVTIGEAEITPSTGAERSLSKYLTVWQRQADGSLKFVVDAGSARPTKR